jgi:hypothetical protein
MKKPESETLSPEVDKAVFDFAIKAYEGHKNHARFQEAQRSWFILAYFSISGLLYGAILKYYVVDGLVPLHFANIATTLLVLHFGLSLLVGLAIAKVSREFRRHFRQGDAILTCVSEQFLEVGSRWETLIRCCKLGTSGDHHHGLRQLIAKRLGVASIHNYIISAFVGADIATVILLHRGYPPTSAVLFALTTFVAAWGFLHFNKLMETTS